MRRPFAHSLVLLGITAVSSQIILIREFFTAFYGNELSIGFILAIWFLGGAVGSVFIGNLLADKLQNKLLIFSATQTFIGLLIPCGIIFARILRPLFGIGIGEIAGLTIFIASSGMVFFPIAAGLGFLFVVGCKIVSRDDPSEASGRVYTLQAIGSAAGGIITSLVLIRYFGALHIACILLGLHLVSSFFLLGKKPLLKYSSLFLASLLAFAATSGGIDFLDRKSLELKWRPFRLMESRDSIYGRTTVTKTENGVPGASESQLNFFTNGLFLFASHDTLTSEESAHFPMAQSPSPEKILLIGGGTSGIMAEILKYPSVKSVDYVELDPLIISSGKKFLQDMPFYALDDRRVTIENTDGRYFIKNTKNLYDVIITCLPNPYTAEINRFYTKEFFEEVKRVLGQNGVLGFSVSSSENYLSKEQRLFLKTLFQTAKSEFAEVKIVPGDTAYFLASDKKGTISLSAEKIASSLKLRGIKTAYMRDYYLYSKLSEERLNFLHRSVHSSGTVRKNRDFYPISYFYDMVLWSSYLDFKLAKFFMFFTRKRLLSFISAFFAVLFIIFVMRRRNKNFKKEVTLLALCTTGLSEISFEILILLAFQIIYGYLYYQIGIIITSFMFGLACGSIYIIKRLPEILRPLKTYIKVQAAVFIYPLLLLACFKIFSNISAYPLHRTASAGLFAMLPFVAGFVGGIQYPLANKICFTNAVPVEKTAGITYAVDLIGAFIGALLLSAFLVPILGIPATCLLVALLNALTLALLLLCPRQPVSAA